MIPRRAARYRRRLAALARRAILGEFAGQLPSNYRRSLVERASSERVDRHVLETHMLAEAHVERYPLDDSLPADFRRAKAFDDRYVYLLADTCGAPRTGLCWFPEGEVLGESCGSPLRLIGWSASDLDDLIGGSIERFDGRAVLLPGGGYFHWLLESVPQLLHALERFPDTTVLVPDRVPRQVGELLALLGVADVKRCRGPVLARELVLTARTPYSGFVPQEDLRILRSTVRRHTHTDHGTAGLPRAIYVTRVGESRSPRNESALEIALARSGVETVRPGEMPLAEQIRLFDSVGLVVGQHGAGLANVAFLGSLRGDHEIRRRGLVEIFPTRLMNDCYARLAVALGAPYWLVAPRRQALARRPPVSVEAVLTAVDKAQASIAEARDAT